MTSIKNYTKYCFIKFQRKYIKAKVFEKMSKLHYPRKVMNAVTSIIQYYINNKKMLTIKSKDVLKCKDINWITDFILNMI
jgi:hypothetical protein